MYIYKLQALFRCAESNAKINAQLLVVSVALPYGGIYNSKVWQLQSYAQ